MDPTPAPPRSGPILLSVALALAAAVYLGYHLGIGTRAEDTNHLETPLALAVARQVTESPRVLYGPFDGTRPLVLIHAPLYYRLGALAAALPVRLGADPTLAALAAGRALALLGFGASLLAAAGLAGLGLDRGRPWAMAWAALLVASAPVFGSFPVTVRPDTLGVFFQTAGAYLVLRAFEGDARRRLVAGYALFGLAAATKQHDIVLAGICSLALGWGWWRGRVRLLDLVLAHLVGLAVVGGYYGLEEWLTGGRMSYAAFRLPSEFRKVAPADWAHVIAALVEVGKRSAGLVLLALAALPLVRAWWARFDRADALLVAMLGAEAAATVALCKGSEGAWYNYAMQAVLLAAVLLARVLGRAAERPLPRWAWAGPVAASLALLGLDARLVRLAAGHRGEERAALAALLAEPRIAFERPEGLYFAGFPQHNRMHGRPELAHDEWLYTAFEATGAAEPRRAWLRRALTDGRVSVVVVPEVGGLTADNLPGLGASLPELGYRPLVTRGRYRAWVRSSSSRDPAPAATASASAGRPPR
jgi:4-amino-4-deoxy-L-arabinose transferase-like glycosyltransferase